MSNILTIPLSSAIYFSDSSAGDSTIPQLSGNSIVLQFDDNAGLELISYNTSSTSRFSVDGSAGRLFNVTDSLTGTIFSVNDVAGLPIIEVISDSLEINRGEQILEHNKVFEYLNRNFRLGVSAQFAFFDGEKAWELSR